MLRNNDIFITYPYGPAMPTTSPYIPVAKIDNMQINKIRKIKYVYSSPIKLPVTVPPNALLHPRLVVMGVEASEVLRFQKASQAPTYQ
jgi:hypothetical protein